MSWPPPRDRWFPGFTAHRDGWVRSYRGRTVYVAGRRATRDEVERAWEVKRNAIDGGERRPVLTSPAYRDVLSDFLASCRHRVATGKPRPMSERTLHNYGVVLNAFGQFVGGSTPIDQCNRPEVFAAFARQYGDWKASGFDSVVCRVGSLFRWAAEMEVIDRYRPGPDFQRPAKRHVRDQRIELAKSFAPDEYARLYHAANATERCWLGLGLFAAMTNSEVAHLPRACVDLDAGVIDFRRRKVGKVRRVCPLPAAVADDLRAYVRPAPLHPSDAGLFFLSGLGNPYGGTRKRDGKPSDSMSRLFRKLMDRAGVAHLRGRNFSGLRTTWYNVARRMPHAGDYDLERRVVMGRAHGTIDLDSYLEIEGVERLRVVVDHVWSAFSTALAGRDASLGPPSVSAAAASGSPAGRTAATG